MSSPTPFVDRVPKDPIENMRWRAHMRKAALHDKELQKALYDAAMTDPVFWFAGFCWCFEPRSLVKIKPMVPWPHQIPAILAMDKVISDSEALEEPIDAVVDKSRAQGATWLYLMVFLRRWLRDPLFSAGLVTRNEKLVDSATDSDTLLWKVDWMLKRLPFWMLPEGYLRNMSDHSITNPANGATFVGYSATGDTGRGGRKTVFALDEIGSEEFIAGGKDYAVLDSTQHVTNCRLLVSTYGGDTGAFYEAATEDNNAVKIILDWKDNPTQNRLSYVVRQGVAVAINQDEQEVVTKYVKDHADDLKKLERRGHTIEGRQRSPWYDSQCLRPGATPRSIAKELDRNPRGAVGKVFDVDVLDRMKKDHCKPPVWQGKLVFDSETLEVKGLIQQENGPLKLWFMPGPDNSAPSGPFVVGHDISAGGTGDYSSNSTICGVDRRTGEQVLEFAVMGMMATKFARLGIAVAKWLHNAYMIWEASGPTGATFAKVVIEDVCYGNVFYREVEEVGNRAKSRKPGWWNGKDEDKGELFETLCIAMDDGEFIPRSEDLIRECGEYEWENGKIVHKPTKQRGIDGKAHGDRCVGAGVAWLGCKDRPMRALDQDAESAQNPPYGSFAWRQMREEDERRKWSDDEPQFSLRDLMRGN